MAGRVGELLVQHLSGVGIDHHGRGLVLGASALGRQDGQPTYGEQQEHRSDDDSRQ